MQGGLPIDLSAAVHHFRDGIDMGNHDCKAHFAWMTLQGQGVPEKDLIKGMTMLKEAEAAGSLEALCYLGFISMEGVGMCFTSSLHELMFFFFKVLKVCQIIHLHYKILQKPRIKAI